MPAKRSERWGRPSDSATEAAPYRQIRALHDETTITVYQAYQDSIAGPAVAQQSLLASPDFQVS